MWHLLRLTWFSGLFSLFVISLIIPAVALKATASNTPAPGIEIVDVHEHIQSMAQARKLVNVMDRVGIKKIILVGSSRFTITQNPNDGFTRYDENNRELLKIMKAFPGRFEAWPTVDPKDPDKLAKFKEYVKDGASGLKLYLGHGFVNPNTGTYFFHVVPIDDPVMDELYAFCQEKGIPVCLHVNPGPKTPGFAQEFVSMLSRYPGLKVICPHYLLSSIADNRLRVFLDTFDNLYTDIGFGHDDLLIAGLKRISRNPDKFRDIFRRYPNRFFFATDMVFTDNPKKNEKWIEERFRAYLDMLSKRSYRTPILPGVELNGLGLSKEMLQNISYRNFDSFLKLKLNPKVTPRAFDWERAGFKSDGKP
jgi:predicted TIM-barrel fold metal-dependent hydrolase